MHINVQTIAGRKTLRFIQTPLCRRSTKAGTVKSIAQEAHYITTGVVV